MDIFIKIILILCVLALLIITFIKLNNRISKAAISNNQLVLSRAALYAVFFTPTAYHHAPNTIIAPFHLSTIGGNLFYAYEYTFSMFTYGVLMPIAIGFFVIFSVLTMQHNFKSS